MGHKLAQKNLRPRKVPDKVEHLIPLKQTPVSNQSRIRNRLAPRWRPRKSPLELRPLGLLER
jgi:hypothetical protein